LNRLLLLTTARHSSISREPLIADFSLSDERDAASSSRVTNATSLLFVVAETDTGFSWRVAAINGVIQCSVRGYQRVARVHTRCVHSEDRNASRNAVNGHCAAMPYATRANGLLNSKSVHPSGLPLPRFKTL
jgi:hypothetical protein